MYKPAKRMAEGTHDPANVDKYKSIKNSLKTMIRTAKLDYIKSLLSHSCHSPKFRATLWSEINKVIGRCQSQIILWFRFITGVYVLLIFLHCGCFK